MNAAKVGAVVLTWNDTEMAGRCIRTVLENDYPNTQVILVDNGSIEPCGKQLGERFPEIEVVVNPVNRGFTGGSNSGIEHALELDCDYILLLNNDTVVRENTISALVEEMDARDDVGLATPLLTDLDYNVVAFYRGTVERDVARHMHEPSLIVPLNDCPWPTVETDFAPFCATMFRAKALRQTGLLDESLGTNWEDYDLCLRLGDAGWKLITVGTAAAGHLPGQTTGQKSPYITYYSTRNRLVCLFRYGHKLGILKRSPHLVRSFIWQIRRYGWMNFACHRAFARGVFDFLVGVRGEGNPPKSRKG